MQARLPGERIEHVLEFGQAARFESLHPYPNSTSRSQEIGIAGARRLRLHFARLATEFGADFVRILGPEPELASV